MAIFTATNGLSWDDLRHLEAIERLGSVAAAGRELGVAASTVYRRIDALEEALGVQCIVRGGGVTPAARALADLARRTGDSLVAISRQANRTHQEVHGSVTLSTIDGFAPLLAEPIAALASAYPKLEINLHISNKGLSLRKRQADIGLSAVDRPGPHLIGRRLFSIDYGVFGTARVVEAHQDARWVIMGWPMQSTREARWERARIAPESVAVATPSRRAFVDMVAAGIGLGLLPRRLAALHPQLIEVESYRPDVVDMTRTAWLLTHPELHGHARIAVVMQTLAEHLR